MGIRIESIGIHSDPDNTGKSTLELTQNSGDACFRESGYDRNDIDLVLHATTFRNKDQIEVEPAFAVYIQNALEINQSEDAEPTSKTFALDIMDGSLGFMQACQIAEVMIKAGKSKTVLVISGESNDYIGKTGDNAGIHPGHKEAGAAAILDQAPGAETGFSNFYIHQYPEHLDKEDVHIKFVDKKWEFSIYKNSEINNIYMDVIRDGVSRYLTQQGKDINGYDLILPPQVAPGFIPEMAEMLGYKGDRCIDITDRNADLYTGTMPMAMKYSMDEGLAKSGQKALIVNVGAGIKLGCAEYTF